MANSTVVVDAQGFPNGATLNIYEAQGIHSWPGVAPGPVITTAAVASGQAAVTGLVQGRPYFAAKSTDLSKYFLFGGGPAPAVKPGHPVARRNA